MMIEKPELTAIISIGRGSREQAVVSIKEKSSLITCSQNRRKK
jgi:hypothetical protein